MSDVLAKILMGILWKVLTEKVVSKLLVYGMDAAAKSTTFTNVDDKMVAAVAEALGVER